MVQEATMICIDNSEWMRNSDFSPSRFESQQDAVNLICGAKTRQNVENVVGLITTAGKQRVEVQVSLTTDLAKILGALHRVTLGGENNVVTAIQIARLALRHRSNKRQEQRIVLFVGSPVAAELKELTQLGGQLKKNKIAVDIVNFGEENEQNEEKLRAFHKSVNNHDNSTIVTIPPGTSMLSEVLSTTAIVRGVGNESTGAGAGSGGAFDWVDPELDPELAMALRLSMESAAADRQNANANESSGAGSGSGGGGGGGAVPMDEDPDIAAALKLSLEGMDGFGEDDDLQRALQMSMMSGNEMEVEEKTPLLPDTESNAPKEEPEADAEMGADEIASMLLDLPGIDVNDPEIQAQIAQMKKDADKK